MIPVSQQPAARMTPPMNGAHPAARRGRPPKAKAAALPHFEDDPAGDSGAPPPASDSVPVEEAPAKPVAGDIIDDDGDLVRVSADGGLELLHHAYPVAARTLVGDLRDLILDRVKHGKSKGPWEKLGEREQKDFIASVEDAALSMARRAIDAVAAAGRRTIAAELVQLTIKDEVKATLELSKHDPMMPLLYAAAGSRVLVVVADPKEFSGERAPAEVMKDQPDLTLARKQAHENATASLDEFP